MTTISPNYAHAVVSGLSCTGTAPSADRTSCPYPKYTGAGVGHRQVLFQRLPQQVHIPVLLRAAVHQVHKSPVRHPDQTARAQHVDFLRQGSNGKSSHPAALSLTLPAERAPRVPVRWERRARLFHRSATSAVLSVGTIRVSPMTPSRRALGRSRGTGWRSVGPERRGGSVPSVPPP